MRFGFLITLLVSVTLLSAPAAAELVRIEMGSTRVSPVPDDYDTLIRRVNAIGVTITWQDQPYYDGYYTAHGGASVGSLTVTFQNDTLTVSWLEFDEVGACTLQAAELDAMYAGAGYLRYRASGRHMVQVYAHSGNSVNAEDLLTRLVGR